MWFNIADGEKLVECYVTDSFVHIPEGIAEIGEEAFKRCDKLKSVHLPSGLRVIGDGAFRNCHALEKITIPGSVERIGERAFFDCIALSGCSLIRLSEKSENEDKLAIGAGAFSECRKLRQFAVRKGRGTLYCDLRKQDVFHTSGSEAFGAALQKWFKEDVIHPWKTEYCGTEIISADEHSIFNSHIYGECLNYFLMIAEGDYGVPPVSSYGMELKAKRMLQMYGITPEDEAVCSYIEQYMLQTLPDIVRKCDDPAGILRKLLETGRFLTRQNMDALIEIAIQQEEYELQLMLTEYKRTHFGYEAAEDRFRL